MHTPSTQAERIAQVVSEYFVLENPVISSSPATGQVYLTWTGTRAQVIIDPDDLVEVYRGDMEVETLVEKLCEENPWLKAHRDLFGQGGDHFLSHAEKGLLDKWFSYHPPKGDQVKRYEKLRAQARLFAETIMANVPDCADRSAALRKVREAVMSANAGIACEESD